MSQNLTLIKEKVDKLKALINKYSHSYYVDEAPEVSDTEYDRLYNELEGLEKKYPSLITEDSPTQKPQSDLSSFLEEKEHSIKVLSLDKAYSSNEIMNFITRCKNECKNTPSFTLEEKIDGLSIVLYYKDGLLDLALTRGNGYVGGDVTASAARILSIPQKLNEKIDIAVRGEVYLSKERFVSLNSKLDIPYSSSRNLASGLLRNKKRIEDEKKPLPLNIFVYEGFSTSLDVKDHFEMLSYLDYLGLRTNKNVYKIENKDCNEEYISSLIEKKTKERKSLSYDIDGLVFKLNNFEKREVMGYTGHHPRWAIAYKFDSPTAVTKVKDIIVQVGRTGRITPVAIFEKAKLLGASIERATLHNKEYIDTLELSVGDTVSISRRGDVIPQVDEVIEKNESGNKIFTLPSICPSCGSHLEQIGPNTFCKNKNCLEKILSEIEYFVSKDCMDIEGVGRSLIDKLYSLGLLKDYTDLYTIDYQKELKNIEGFKDKKISNIIKNINESKTKPFVNVLVSLGIDGIGKSNAEKLISANIDSFEKLFKIAEDKDIATLTSSDCIGEVLANNIINYFNDADNKIKVQKLISLGLSSCYKDEDNVVISDVLKDQVWCVTGSIRGYKNPDVALLEVKKRGARIVSSVSKKTTHLLVGSEAGSKLEKAIALKTVVIVKQENFKDYLL